MQNRQNNNVVYCICIIIIVFFFGCSVEQTHKTVTFFFDGVDQINVFNNYLSKDSISKDAVVKRDQLLKKNRPELYAHKPYKEKKCESCHTADKRLRMPMPGLCFQCHKNFIETNKYVHGPVASGNCLKCHNQHNAKFAKLLIRQGQQICLFCHNSSSIFKDRIHKDIEDAECTTCHNPHGGSGRFMIKESLVRNFNGYGISGEFASRHISGQIFHKLPGDIGAGIEITVTYENGEVVSTSRTDDSGKFIIANLHPDQDYTFKFNNENPGCRINLLNSENQVVFVVDKNRKGKYLFDKAAYETVHEAMAKPEEQTELKQGFAATGGINADAKSLTGDTKEKSAKPAPAGNSGKTDESAAAISDTGKVAVKVVPEVVSTEELLEGKKLADSVATKEITNDKNNADSNVQKEKLVVGALPVNNNVIQTPDGKKQEVAGKFEVCGTPLLKMAQKIAPAFSGTVVWVLNEDGRLLGEGKVNEKGDFLLNDNPPWYHIKFPVKDKTVVAQTIFLNDKMELVEIIDKKNVNGHFVYSPNTSLNGASVMDVIEDNEVTGTLFSTVNFDNGKSNINDGGIKELNKVAENLVQNSEYMVQLVAYANPNGNRSFNVALAEDRVTEAIVFLESQGISRSRISSKGFDKTKPSKRTGKATAMAAQQCNKMEVYIKTNEQKTEK